MLIEDRSQYLLKKTRAKAKMYEFDVPEELHVQTEPEIADLLLIAIGVIGDVAAEIVRINSVEFLENDKTIAKVEFAANFFDSFMKSKLDEESKDYYVLLGAVAYFFARRMGSANVLIKNIDVQQLDLGVNGIDKVLAEIIVHNTMDMPLERFRIDTSSTQYHELFEQISELIRNYNTNVEMDDTVDLNIIRSQIYEFGTALEILLIDALLAIILIKESSLATKMLPQYTDIDKDVWNTVLDGGNLLKELWPSQIKLGQEGVYNGKSSVVQMATGTGKTKAISLIVYSAFLSQRSTLSVIVTPFRSLCREIAFDLERDFKFNDKISIEQLSDILSADQTFLEINDGDNKSIVVVTPEKLMYILRQQPEILGKINQIIFDEAHLFDDSHRGTSYELLVSEIKAHLHADTQKILISAVMSNASDLNDWVNDGNGVVISDNSIKSTDKKVAFTDWESSGGKRYGYLYYVDSDNPMEEEFYVPRLVDIVALQKKPRERNERTFPQIKNGKVQHNDIAIYYGLKLCRKGALSIYCGRKDIANNIISRILELEERGYSIDSILESSKRIEIERITRLIQENYGTDCIYYDGAKRGIFVHHAGISNGLRIAIEYAMQKSKLSFLICTSTLAQGVNLPIRYLIVSTLYQGKNRIRVRDFHNLIGRVGRPGVYTEGSILLTEMDVYKARNSFNNWKWGEYKKVLNPNNSEPCLSTLTDLVKVFTFEDNRNSYNYSCFEHLINYYTNEDQYDEFINKLSNTEGHVAETIGNLHRNCLSTLSSIESYIMSYLVNKENDYEVLLTNLIKRTYGYHLATYDEKLQLTELFLAAGKYVVEKVPDERKRIQYSKSLLGVKMNLIIESWIDEHIALLNECSSENSMFTILAPLLFENSDNSKILKLQDFNSFLDIGKMWLSGNTYEEILMHCRENIYKIESKNTIRTIELDDVIDICDRGLGYATILLVTGVAEIFSKTKDYSEKSYMTILNLSSQLRYGLSDKLSVLIYEIGFSDRVIAQRISNEIQIPLIINKKRILRRFLKSKSAEVYKIIKDYPQVFIDRLENL